MKLQIGDTAPDFNNLPCVDGKNYSLSSFDDKKAVVVIFSCNHCPYVIAYEDRMIDIQKDYADKGVAFVAINPNDDKKYPADSFDKMVIRAEEKGFNFPYLRDETQEIASAYGAERTPEIFLLDEDRKLVYHGRIDDNTEDVNDVKRHDLREALDELLAGKDISVPETSPVGCTIKWK